MRLICLFCNVSDRYVWAHRTALARSVHDMAKQMYSNKRYSDRAWGPLREWLFDPACNNIIAAERSDTLTKFDKNTSDFYMADRRTVFVEPGQRA